MKNLPLICIMLFCINICHANEKEAQAINENNKNPVKIRLFGPQKKLTPGTITITDENGIEKKIYIDNGVQSFYLPPKKYIFHAESDKFKNVRLEVDLKNNFLPFINLNFQKRKDTK